MYGGPTGLSSTATLNVHIADLNDNPPTFDQPWREVSVSEATLPGTPLMTLVAKDIDDYPNNRLQYSLTAGGMEQFHVDSNSGDT